MTGLVCSHFKDVAFDKLEDEQGSDFKIESHSLAIDFRQMQDNLMKKFYVEGEHDSVEQLRQLSFEDLVHFAHNGVLGWESYAKWCEEGSDNYIDASNVAYEWLKIARLGEYTIRERYIGKPRADNTTWPR